MVKNLKNRPIVDFGRKRSRVRIPPGGNSGVSDTHLLNYENLGTCMELSLWKKAKPSVAPLAQLAERGPR